MAKEEIANNEQFHILSQCFSTLFKSKSVPFGMDRLMYVYNNLFYCFAFKDADKMTN